MAPASDSPSIPKARILVVGLEKPLFQRIEPLLSRSHFALERVPRGTSGATLASHARFDLLIVRYPLPDIPLGDLLHGVRREGSPCRDAHLLILAEDSAVEEAGRQTPGEPVLSLSQPSRLLEEVAARLLGVAPRVASRLLVQLDVQLPEGKTLLMCQSENLSEAGMLLRAPRPYPLGTRVTFEMTVPGDRTPLAGDAEVVRHAVADVEEVQGVGVKFLELKEDSPQRLRAFIERNLPPEQRGRRRERAPAPPPATAPSPPPSTTRGAREIRERHRCQDCERPYVVIYEMGDDEGQEIVAVACPHCWHRNQVMVGDGASQTQSFRAEKEEG